MNKIRKWLAPILTILLWCCLMLLSFVTVNIGLGIKSQYMYTMSCVGVVIMVVTTLVWYPTGTEKGENSVKAYNLNKVYSNRANYIVNKQYFKELREFCQQRNIEFAEELKTDILAENQITKEEFETFKKLYQFRKSKDDTQNTCQRLLVFYDKYSPKQTSIMIRLANHNPKFDKIEPNDLIKGYKTKKTVKPKNYENIFRVSRVMAKIIWGLFIGLFSTGMIINLRTFDILMVMNVILWTSAIVTNIFSAISNGYKSVTVYRYEYLTDKNDRCAEFFKFIGISVEDIDKDILSLLKREG